MDEIIKHGNEIRPGYYQSAMGDVFDIADAYGLSFPLGNAVKYICRAGKKESCKTYRGFGEGNHVHQACN